MVGEASGRNADRRHQHERADELRPASGEARAGQPAERVTGDDRRRPGGDRLGEPFGRDRRPECAPVLRHVEDADVHAPFEQRDDRPPPA
jgi:hypothetical protein